MYLEKRVVITAGSSPDDLLGDHRVEPRAVYQGQHASCPEVESERFHRSDVTCWRAVPLALSFRTARGTVEPTVSRLRYRVFLSEQEISEGAFTAGTGDGRAMPL